MRLPGSYFADFRADMLAKRDLLAGGLERAGFKVFRPAGTYFITTGIRPRGESDGFTKREEVLREAAERLRRI